MKLLFILFISCNCFGQVDKMPVPIDTSSGFNIGIFYGQKMIKNTKDTSVFVNKNGDTTILIFEDNKSSYNKNLQQKKYYSEYIRLKNKGVADSNNKYYKLLNEK